MIIAIILSGGIGTRIGLSIPKQYVLVNNQPIIKYSYDTFLGTVIIDGIIIVADNEWRDYLKETIDLNSNKFLGFANSGESRQESVLNGLCEASKHFKKGDKNIVFIHDAARPNVTKDLILSIYNSFDEADGIMPVLPSKDTMYYCENNSSITSLLERDKIFFGQSPEAFLFDKYFKINMKINKEQIALIKGSSEIAFRYGMKIRIIPGDENNYKITTMADLEKFKQQMERCSKC